MLFLLLTLSAALVALSRKTQISCNAQRSPAFTYYNYWAFFHLLPRKYVNYLFPPWPVMKLFCLIAGMKVWSDPFDRPKHNWLMGYFTVHCRKQQQKELWTVLIMFPSNLPGTATRFCSQHPRNSLFAVFMIQTFVGADRAVTRCV